MNAVWRGLSEKGIAEESNERRRGKWVGGRGSEKKKRRGTAAAAAATAAGQGQRKARKPEKGPRKTRKRGSRARGGGIISGWEGGEAERP